MSIASEIFPWLTNMFANVSDTGGENGVSDKSAISILSGPFFLFLDIEG
jgi:hypothetical protein